MAKNHFSKCVFEQMRQKMSNQLTEKGAFVDAEYYCFHHPYASVEKYKKICTCRKPKPGMLEKASKEHNVDLSKSWMIGDGISDIQAGYMAGCKTILIGRMKCDLCKIMDKKRVKPDYIKPNLYKASSIIK